MSVNVQISTELDTATPELQHIQRQVSPHRMAEEIGPRATRLVQRNFLKLGPNKRDWPSTHFWGRAAEATNWQEGFGFVMININQIGVRQQLLGGDIKPVRAGALTIPAVAEAYGKTAREFNSLRFGFAFDAERNVMRPALVEAEASEVKIGKQKKDGSRSVKRTGARTGTKAIFWLAKGVKQFPHPTVLPSDEEFGVAMDQSMDALLRNPVRASVA
jgi:hypothetical protein